MSQQKLTPGPWEVDRQDGAERGARVLVITQDQKIAVAALWEDNVDTLDALMPDARAIAEVPAMLALLRDWLEMPPDATLANIASTKLKTNAKVATARLLARIEGRS